jgi:polysaccharide biosynthesis protein PslG
MRSIIRLFGAVFCILASAAGPAWAVDPALPYGINAHLPSSALLDWVTAAGLAWIRVDFNWVTMEPARGVYDWSLTDIVVTEAWARGLNIYATLAYSPPWANGGQAPNTPPLNSDDWYNFVYETVSRYREQVQHWGMWNEPNFKEFWSGSLTQYLQMILEVGARAVRDAQGGLVLGPELGMGDDWWGWFSQILAQKSGDLDIVTIHSYEDSGHDVLGRVGGPVPPWERPTVRDVMRATGTTGKPLWLTETGWNTAEVSEDQQASSVDQVLEGFQSAGIAKVFVYQLVDDPYPEWYGILRQDLSPKPAYGVYQRRIASQASTTALSQRSVDSGMPQE